MSKRRMVTVDANEAVAAVAHRLSEVIVIYPITPSSPMGELADEWSAHGRTNLWGDVPSVVQMQSEAGAIGSVHGALQGGATATTFTASQGLLLMIPSMYKIAGELTSFCMHVAARTVATHSISIFGDHSDVMACRQTGFAMLCSGSVQEAQDLACIAHAATTQARVPFLHFFDGFRTSHEVSTIEELGTDDVQALVDEEALSAHRARAMTPDAPFVRGTAQNPDAFFQAREATNPYYAECPAIVQRAMDRFAELTARQYRLFEYVGHAKAEHVIVLMGSGTQTVDQTVQRLIELEDAKVGVVKVRLYRPFVAEAFVAALPSTVTSVAVLDRTKEPGAVGEPLYLDVVTALEEAITAGHLAAAKRPAVIGGRYGLASKEFTPSMAKAVFDELASKSPKRHFTVGITDDLTHLSLSVDPTFDIESDDINRAVFYGLGADGTVGANKNSIKIIGEETDNFAQGYFVYDSRKAGTQTASHLRFGPRPIRSAYLISHANFIGCHQWAFVHQTDVLAAALPGAVFLLNSPYGPDDVWGRLPREMQTRIIEKQLEFYVIDAYGVARASGMGRLINTVMQTCFFAISGIFPRDKAISQIKKAIDKTYGPRGAEIVRRNYEAVDRSLANLHQVIVPDAVSATQTIRPTVPGEAPDFVQRVTRLMLEGNGDLLPVSAFPPDGTWPSGTSAWEKRNIAAEVPIWEPDACIQCNKCALVCPHAAIRSKVYDAEELEKAPDTFLATPYRGREFPGMQYSLQVAPEDCTGCSLCVHVCPAKDKAEPRRKTINMTPHLEVVDRERENYRFFLSLPELDRTQVQRLDVKTSQFLQPLLEYSGACAGCGETPYIKLVTQIFGDRATIANATGCSSIYGGNLPTTPYTTNPDGRGPAWSNSLFEDNAEFGSGLWLAMTGHRHRAERLLRALLPDVGEELADGILEADQTSESGIVEQRERVMQLKERLTQINTAEARQLAPIADYLVKKSLWIVGGDGWAYDIGFGGVDHVMASNIDVNILVLDTEVYSNTGGQASKATPLGAAAKFASAGKGQAKKDLGLMAMSYGHVYVASVAMGANDAHTVRAFVEAEAYPGTSLIIAYSHCVAHGYDLANGMTQQNLAVDSGVWPLYRFDPRRSEAGQPPLHLDSRAPRADVKDYMRNEARFRMVERMDPQRFKQLAQDAQRDTERRVSLYRQLAELRVKRDGRTDDGVRRRPRRLH